MDAAYDVTTVGANESTSAGSSGLEDDMAACELFDFAIEGVVMGLLCALGLCGNALSIICLAKEKSKTATPFLLMSLEVADSLFLILAAIVRVFHTNATFTGTFTDRNAWNYIGRVTYPVAMITETATVYLTLLVTFNRYVSVCKLQAQPRNKNYKTSARLQVLGVIVFSCVYNLPRFFEFEIKPANAAGKQVIALDDSKLALNKFYNIIYTNCAYFIVMFLFPLVVLLYLNRQLILALREMKQRRARLGNTESRSEEDITRMLVTVVVVFFVCQAPGLVTQILGRTLSMDERICPSAYFYYARISDMLIVLNSSVNFIIYCFCNKRFRDNLRGLLCRGQTTNEFGQTELDARTTCNQHQQRQTLIQNGSCRVPAHSCVAVDVPKTRSDEVCKQ